MKKFKKYDKYKNTDIAWLNKIPSHWTEIPNRCFLTELKNKVGKNSSKYTLLSLTKNGVIIRDLSEMKGKFPAEFDSYKIVNKGNLILCLFDIEETPRTVGLSKFKGMITGAYNVLKIENVNPQFITYFYIALDNTKELRSLYRGLRKTIKIGKFLSIKTPIPPIDEQDKIVSFIEYKEKQINKLIKKQKKLIKLLKEQKSVIINEAVTKGIDKTAQMKDSGIKWLTQIPQHWEIKRTKFVAKSFAKGNGITKDDVILNGDIRCIRYGEIYSKYDVQVLDCVSSTNIDIINSPRYISNGDILFAGTGELVEEIGKNVVYMGSEPCLAGGDIIIMKHKQDALFINYALNSKYAQAQKSFGKVKLKVVHISAGNIGNIRIALPPIEEQKKIAEYLNEKCSKINEIILQKEQIITKLIEYKTSLISNAVTGQIDVRDYEIPKTDDDVDLEEIENFSEDDTETISEVEYANN